LNGTLGSVQTQKGEHAKGKVRSMLISFLSIKEIVHKEFVLESQTSVPHTTVTFYGDCLKMCEDFAPNFGDMHYDSAPSHTSFFTREFFRKNNITIFPHLPYFSVFPIQDKTERPPF
jgi:hypothetical protein